MQRKSSPNKATVKQPIKQKKSTQMKHKQHKQQPTIKKNSHLLSMLPFFSVCTSELSPFSCLNVVHTSSRKSRAISSFTKCSLININKTVGGTEPLPANEQYKKNTKIFILAGQLKKKKITHQSIVQSCEPIWCVRSV